MAIGTVTVGDVFARVVGRCREQEKFVLEPEAILRNIKFSIMALLGAASTALPKYYEKKESINVSGGALSLSGKNYFRVTGVSYGLTESYNEARSASDFVNRQRANAHESATDGRWYYWMPGDSQILVFQGTSLSASETSLNVWFIGYPDTTFTMSDVTTNTMKIDVPDFIVSYVIDWAAAITLREQRLELPGGMDGNIDNVVQKIDQNITNAELLAEKARKDVVSS